METGEQYCRPFLIEFSYIFSASYAEFYSEFSYAEYSILEVLCTDKN